MTRNTMKKIFYSYGLHFAAVFEAVYPPHDHNVIKGRLDLFTRMHFEQYVLDRFLNKVKTPFIQQMNSLGVFDEMKRQKLEGFHDYFERKLGRRLKADDMACIRELCE